VLQVVDKSRYFFWKVRGLPLILPPRLSESRYNRPPDMKKDIHPNYREVVFKDISADTMFIGKSTIYTRDTIVWEDGNTYPLVKLDISSASHPFFTGKQKFVDAAGRVDKFFARYGKKKGAAAEAE